MSIKQLCFDAQAQLHDQHGIAVRRTHLYELLAALLGFNSHAALTANAVIGQLQQAQKFNSDELVRLSKRSLDLDYPPEESKRIVEVVAAMAENHRLVAINVRHLLIRPDEVLSGILDAPVLEVTHDALRVLLQHRHVSAGCVT